MTARGPDIDARSRGTSPAPPSSPAAARATRSRWRDPRLVVGVVLVAACALLGARLLGGADDTVGVWAARRALNAGESVSADDLVRRDVRFADQDDADAYLSADTPLPSGATLDARRGRRGAGAARRARRGAGLRPSRRCRCRSTARPCPATLRVGAVVDVWVTPDRATDGSGPVDGSDAARSVLVFDDVAVLSVPRSGTSLGPTATRQVIVGVDEDQQSRLPTSLAALAGGTVVLTAQR